MTRSYMLSLTPSRIIFYGSALLPYLLDLFPTHSAGSHSSESLFLDFIALLALAISSIILAIDVSRLHSIAKGLFYPITAITVVVLYSYSFDYRIGARELLAFYLRKHELETHVSQLTKGPFVTNNIEPTRYSPPEDSTWYGRLTSGIILCTTELEASVYSAGYAYSPKHEKPSGEYYEWHKLTGHWYRWKRRD